MLAHCTVDSCGVLPGLNSGYDAAITISLTHSVWTNPLGTYVMGASASDAVTTGTRLIDSCVFNGRVSLFSPIGYTITNSYFGDMLNSGSSSPTWVSLDGCFFTRANDDGAELLAGGSMTNNYFYTTQSASHYILLNSSAGSSNISYNVAENGGSGAFAAFCETEETTAPVTYTYQYNILFSSGAGTFNNGIVASSNPANSINNTIFQHNTIVTNGGNCIIAPGGGMTGNYLQTNSIQSVQANIFYNTGSAAGVYVLNNNTSPPSSSILNPAPATA